MTVDLVSIARGKRNSLPVLLAKFMVIRKSDPGSVIAVFEGDDDLGVWPIWFARCGFLNNIEALPCNGKERVLDLRDRLMGDLAFDPGKRLFFVDRDFDDLMASGVNSDIFITDRYSIENYFLNVGIVDYILTSMFGCAGLVDEKRRIKELYLTALASFITSAFEMNFRGYCARQAAIKAGDKRNRPSYPSKLTDTVKVLDGLKFEPHPSGAEASIPIAEDISKDELESYRAQFVLLDAPQRHRGKFLKMFLVHFYGVLQTDRNAKDRKIFSSDLQETKIKYTGLSLAALAGMSDLPLGLRDFLDINILQSAA